jgi:hypothetical protein
MNAHLRPTSGRQPLVWSLTTGEAGLRAQANGLARQLSADSQEKIVRVSRLAALAPPALFRSAGLGVTAVEGAIAAPWPDVLVSCGRRAGLAAISIRGRCGSPMVMVHIQPPSSPAAFDLIVTLPHDRLAGRNVLQVKTALHGVRGSSLRSAASAGDHRFASLPRPWTTVLLGGATARSEFSIADAQRLAEGLDALRARTGGSLLITPSRRTPHRVTAALGARFVSDMNTFFWDGGGANPYLAMLAGADVLVVTSDSISMVSEALATTADVWLFDVKGGERHRHFMDTLLQARLVARLGEAPPPPRPRGFDSTPLAAAAVRGLIAGKLGLEIHPPA